ncbi:transporter substrate-binding domain-containing protein [Pseudomonas sp. LS44]|uniref:substrate-binding periplasmic protein n=1 Tax=Pseudomonas sp. LS44 TaxID=1357074 RepID=UPI00215AC20D|nr:transporter substrate-binding domain-containing protein [Pseudomonas sp. LS44]UVE18735.1 transporter substrate-binding domain-containing protein [Pseudomonas sp. LS44]
MDSPAYQLHVLRFGLIALLLSTGLSAVHAAEPAQRYGCSQPIRLALYKDQIFYRDGQGIDPSMVAELQQRSGCEFEVGVLPRSEIWMRLQAGTLDMATSGIATPQRRGFAFFVPYMYVRNKLILPASLSTEVQSLEAFVRRDDARLGVVRGYRHGPYLESGVRILRSAGRVVEFADDAARFAALRRGEVSALIGHDLSFSSLLPEDEQLNYRIIDVVPGPSIPHGLILTRTHFSPAQAAEWLRLVEAMRLQGRLADIMRANASPALADELLNSGYRYDLAKQGRQP